MTDCIFCDIAKGQAKASIVYEDDRSVAFMDLMPVTQGHLLIIPKAHVRNIYDCPPELTAHLMAITTQLAEPLRQATNCDGCNVFVANEAVAGQEIWHLHVHLIPRYQGDDFGFRFPSNYPQEASRDELDQTASEVQNHLPEQLQPNGGP